MELNKRIFISHSGEDKPFVRKLYTTLLHKKYDPFFDEVTLRKGDIVNMSLIMAEADKSKLCLFVLSHDFFMNTENPMLELVSFLRAQQKDPLKKLLPLFYKLSVVQFKEAQTKWFEKWQEWEQEDKDKGIMESNVNLKRWKEALKRIRETTGIEMKEMTEERYIEAIVSNICKIIPPDMPYEVSYAQGRDRMSKVVEDLFVKFETKDEGFIGPSILGIHGMGGLGKTTLSKVLWNSYWSEFEGRVIRVELGSQKESSLQRMHAVLKTLRNTNENMLMRLHDVDQARGLYLNAIGQNRVFLIIDNAEVEYEEEVHMYLEGDFHRCSRVLILSRSKSFLEDLRPYCTNFCIKEMPSLTKEEAESMFLQKLHLCRESISVVENDNMRDAIEMCCFEGVYHPMAVAVLGSWMKDKEDWQSVVNSLSKTPVCKLGNTVISHLKKSFDDMHEMPQRVLLDLALYLPSRSCFNYDPYEWLRSLNKLDEVELNNLLAKLRKRAFLSDDLVVHELVKELAIEAARSNTNLGCVYLNEKNKSQSWERLGDANLERFGMERCQTHISTLILRNSFLQALKIIDTQGLKKIKIGKDIVFLQSMEVRNNEIKIDPPRGLSNILASSSEFMNPSSGNIIIEASGTFNNLKWVSVEKCEPVARSDDSVLLPSLRMLVPWMVSSRQSRLSIAKFGSLCCLRMHVDNHLKFPLGTLSGCSNSLEHLDLGGFDMGKSICVRNFSRLREFELSGCPSAHTLQFGYMPSIKSISISDAPRLKSIGGLEGCSSSLKTLCLYRCMSFESFLGLNSLCLMEDLLISDCESLVRLEGLEKLDSLIALSIYDCNGLVSLFEGVVRSEDEETSSSLINLRYADVNDCPNLTDRSGIANLSSISSLGDAINQNVNYVHNILDVWNELILLDIDDELLNKRSIAMWKRQFLEAATSKSESVPVVPCGLPYHRFITLLLCHGFSDALSLGFFKILTASICWSSQEEQANISSQLEASKSAMTEFISLIEPRYCFTTVLQCLIYLWCHGQTPFFQAILEMAGGIDTMLHHFSHKSSEGRFYLRITQGLLLSAIVALMWPENLPDLATQIATMFSIILSDMNALHIFEMRLIVDSIMCLPTAAKQAIVRLLNEENVRREYEDILDIDDFLSIIIHLPENRFYAIVRLVNENGRREFQERFSDKIDSPSIVIFVGQHAILGFLNAEKFQEYYVKLNNYPYIRFGEIYPESDFLNFWC